MGRGKGVEWKEGKKKGQGWLGYEGDNEKIRKEMKGKAEKIRKEMKGKAEKKKGDERES